MDDQYFIEKAIDEAKKALKTADIPVGAIIVKDNKIIASAHNQKEATGDPSAHAELLAIKKASETLKDWRLVGCTMYSTLEPCPMCFGAILHARIDRVVFGANDLKWGACGSIVNLAASTDFNHQVAVDFLRNEACATLLTDFFKQLRQRRKS